MAYVARTDRPADKAARYHEVEAEILAVLDGEPNVTARMATVASIWSWLISPVSRPGGSRIQVIRRRLGSVIRSHR